MFPKRFWVVIWDRPGWGEIRDRPGVSEAFLDLCSCINPCPSHAPHHIFLKKMFHCSSIIYAGNVSGHCVLCVSFFMYANAQSMSQATPLKEWCYVFSHIELESNQLRSLVTDEVATVVAPNVAPMRNVVAFSRQHEPIFL